VNAGDPALVGRDDELQAIAALVDGLEGRDGGVVLQVAGEPGIGWSCERAIEASSC
jgi:hypothetical protein